MRSSIEFCSLYMKLACWDHTPVSAASLTADVESLPSKLVKLFCYAVEVYNTIAAIDGLPPFPVPAFCDAPPSQP